MFKIEQLTKNDIDKIIEFEAQEAPPFPIYYAYDRKTLEKDLFGDKDAKAYGVFDKDKLIGWAAYRSIEKDDGSDKGVYEMSGMVVAKKYRRRGIGLKLFKLRLDELLQKRDLKRIYATNYPKNTPIIVLYLTNGFVIYDYKKDLYGPGADRIYIKYEKLEKA